MIRHAIVGCGRIAEHHVDAFRRLPGVELAGALDIRPEQTQAFADQHHISRRYTDFDELLHDPAIDSLSLTTPHFLHGRMALAAVRAGKHVLVEKPLVLDLDEGRALLELAAAGQVVVQPVVQHRFDAVTQVVKELVASPEMGALRLVRGHLECNRPPAYYQDSDWRGLLEKEGGSVLINQAYHLLDLLLYLAGPVRDVSARMRTFRPDIMETEDTLCALLEFQNQALGTLTICGAAGSTWQSYVELIFEHGLVAFDINFPNQLHRFEMRSKRAMKTWRERLRAALPDPLSLPQGVGYYGLSHREQAADFAHAIQSGTPPGGSTLEEALHAISTIQRIYAAAAQPTTALLSTTHEPAC